jgi:hypothetical protein
MITKKNLIVFFLFFFSLYCSLIVGQSWDESYHTNLGKRNLVYLFSLGRVESYLGYSQYYSSLYWSLQYFFSQLFIYKYQTEINHLINLLFSFSAIFALYRIGKQLFNKSIAQILFLLLLFYAPFFGHMGLNPKDTILAFCHLWIFSLVLSYLKSKNNKKKNKKYVYYISFLIAAGTGIQLYFPATLFIIIFFLMIEIFFIKNFIDKKFNRTEFYLDFIKIFFFSFVIFILFAPDTHSNILYKTYLFYLESFKTSRGPSYMLVDGIIYAVKDYSSKLYFYRFFFYKSPEFIIFLYLLFLFLFFRIKKFYEKKIKCYLYRLIIVFVLILYPVIISIVSKFRPYDELRLFLWVIPYFMIIPGITIYFLFKNLKFYFYKIFATTCLILCFVYLIKFFLHTPYQYTYYNIFAGKNINDKFEIDYQGISLKEIIKKNQNLFQNKDIKIATCGLNPDIVIKYIKIYTLQNVKLVEPSQADYIIIVNRALNLEFTCLQLYKGENISEIKRDNKLLSLIRKIKHE